MVFSSIDFLYVFLPAVLILHFAVPKKAKNGVLLLASLVFYYIGEQRLTLIMIASSVVDYFCSL
ncbi:MAG: MBOAT family protein, partial [Clostridiales bacterium]|nr:MBOAT family protein [Clostridiales bacterium]